MLEFTVVAKDSETGEVLSTKEIQFENHKLQDYLKKGDVNIGGIYYSTYEYGIFNHIKGNREPSDSDIKTVSKAYHDCGYMTNPIAITDDLDIFDGEKRLIVHHENGWPIDFTTIDERFTENKSVLDIININNSRKQRTIHDYIHYWASMGDESYIRLEELDKKYALPVPIIYCVIKKKIHSGHLRPMENLKKGNAIITQEEADSAVEFLDFLMLNKKYFNNIRKAGTNNVKFTLLAWCYRQNIDRDRFMSMLKEYVTYDKLSPMTDIDRTLDELTEMYNYKKKVDRVNFRKTYAEQSAEELWKIRD